MSTKDMSLAGKCVICGDVLPGSDDAPMVWEDIEEQVKEIDSGEADYSTPNCALCGEDCPIEDARRILAEGKPEAKPV